MQLSKLFSDLSNDLRLIRMTKDNRYSPEILDVLEQMGWHREERMRLVCHAHLYGSIVASYKDQVFVNENGYQGDKDWYRDLAKAAMPDHKPSFLTNVIG